MSASPDQSLRVSRAARPTSTSTPTAADESTRASAARRAPERGGRRRFTRRSFGACLAAATLVSLVACSSSGSSSSSSSGSPSASGASATAGEAAAKAAIAPYVGKPSAFPVVEPLSKPLPAGTKFGYLQCGTTVCGLVGKVLAPAIKAIGATMTTVNAGSTAQSSQAAASSMLALKPDVVLVSGIEPSVFGGGLKKLSDAGVKVVSISIAENVTPFGITFNYIGAETTVLNGKLLADWVIAHKGPKANVAFYGIPAINFSAGMQEAFTAELAKNCPGCKVRAVQIDVSTLGTTSASRVVSDLQAHSSTNVAVFASSEVAAGLPAAMKAAGLSVTTLGYAPTSGNLQDIKNGGLTAGLAVDLPVSIWAAVDAAARLVEGDQPSAGEKAGAVPTQFLGQSDITFDPSNGWSGYPDFAQRFAKLWHRAG